MKPRQFCADEKGQKALNQLVRVMQKDKKARLYGMDVDGTLYDTREEFGIEELVGVIPSVGDVIVDPDVPSGIDRRDPRKSPDA